MVKMIVAIEGMDGVGKTTVAKYIESKLGFKYIKEPLKELFGLDDVMNISNKVFRENDERIIAWYLALGDAYIMSKYKNEDIVIDRHILHNYFWNGTTNSEDIFKLQMNMFGIPDLTILLYADTETRKKRIISRNPEDPDLVNSNMWIDGYDKMINFLDEYKYAYEVLDTNDMSIDEVNLKCLKLIESKKVN